MDGVNLFYTIRSYLLPDVVPETIFLVAEAVPEVLAVSPADATIWFLSLVNLICDWATSLSCSLKFDASLIYCGVSIVLSDVLSVGAS